MAPVMEACYLKSNCTFKQSSLYNGSFCGPNVNARNLIVNYECMGNHFVYVSFDSVCTVFFLKNSLKWNLISFVTARKLNDDSYAGNNIGLYDYTGSTADSTKTATAVCLNYCRDSGSSHARINNVKGCHCGQSPTSIKLDANTYGATQDTTDFRGITANSKDAYLVYEMLCECV